MYRTLILLLFTVTSQPVLGEDLLGTSYFHLALKVDSYILPFLNYSTMMLEPHIDAVTADNLYEGHHEMYRRNMNEALKRWRKNEPNNEFAKESILKILQNLDKVPEKYWLDIKNQGGGYVNHCFYFGVLSPNLESEERKPEGYLLKDIESVFGGFDEFKAVFEQVADGVFGSGYVWLVRTPGGLLSVITTENEDSPVSDGFYPILVLDLWEHAYYLKHKFRRSDHVKDWWFLVDWNKVEKLDLWWEELAVQDVKRQLKEMGVEEPEETPEKDEL